MVFDLQSNRGKHSLGITPAVINGVPHVAAALIDMPFFPGLTVTAAEARRFAEFILERAQSAERAAYALEGEKPR